MSTVISVENVSKAYRLGMIGGATLKEDFSRWWAKARGKPDPLLKIGQEHHERRVGEQFWALDDVSFEVKQGEVLGIIGRNGAGKSTLLKILSQVTAPTSGEIKIKGRIASLLEVGTGFHPELSGRDNIFLNGAILGMTKPEIRRKFDEIVAFSEIDTFIDTPVKRYSSGMYVRLAFAVAAHLEPEILIVDEVLAVGDIEFQRKCLGKMEDVARGGRTVLFVSHNMTAVTFLCKLGLWMDSGSVKGRGPIEEIVQAYARDSREKPEMVFRPVEPIEGHHVRLLGASILLEDARPYNNKPIRFVSKLQLTQPLRFAATMFVNRNHNLVMVASDYHQPITPSALQPGIYTVSFTIPAYLLNPGLHSIGLMLADYGGNSEQYLNAQDLVQFELLDDGYRRGYRYQLGWEGAVSPLLEVTLEASPEEVVLANA